MDKIDNITISQVFLEKTCGMPSITAWVWKDEWGYWKELHAPLNTFIAFMEEQDDIFKSQFNGG